MKTPLRSHSINVWYMRPQVVLVVKILPATAGEVRDVGSILWSGRSPGGGNGNAFQYSCPENPMHRGAWWATVHRVTESDTTEATYYVSRYVCTKETRSLGRTISSSVHFLYSTQNMEWTE